MICLTGARKRCVGLGRSDQPMDELLAREWTTRPECRSTLDQNRNIRPLIDNQHKIPSKTAEAKPPNAKAEKINKSYNSICTGGRVFSKIFMVGA
jgi:hypothetical protein